MPGSSPGHAVYLNFAIGKHHNFAVTAFVKAKFRCPGQGKVKMSALCQQQTLAYQESCRDVFSSTLVTLE